MVILTIQDYNEKINMLNKPSILFFCSETCIHCEAVEKNLKSIRNEKIVVFKIKDDIDLINRFNIRSFPTVLTFNKDKKPVGKFVGLKSKEFLKLKLKEILE